ncbi:hypothetical protein GCM10025792_54420 [Pseudonocardia tropica]
MPHGLTDALDGLRDALDGLDGLTLSVPCLGGHPSHLASIRSSLTEPTVRGTASSCKHSASAGHVACATSVTAR